MAVVARAGQALGGDRPAARRARRPAGRGTARSGPPAGARRRPRSPRRRAPRSRRDRRAARPAARPSRCARRRRGRRRPGRAPPAASAGSTSRTPGTSRAQALARARAACDRDPAEVRGALARSSRCRSGRRRVVHRRGHPQTALSVRVHQHDPSVAVGVAPRIAAATRAGGGTRIVLAGGGQRLVGHQLGLHDDPRRRRRAARPRSRMAAIARCVNETKRVERDPHRLPGRGDPLDARVAAARAEVEDALVVRAARRSGRRTARRRRAGG